MWKDTVWLEHLLIISSFYSLQKEYPPDLQELNAIRQDFIPYFVNFLRDQTSAILQSNQSSSATPVKTPTSLKYKSCRTSASKTSCQTLSNEKTSKSSRVQLFYSPSPIKPQDTSLSDQSQSPLASVNGSPDETFENRDRVSKFRSEKPKRLQSASPHLSGHSSRTKQNLGDFLMPETVRNCKGNRSQETASPSYRNKRQPKASSKEKGNRQQRLSGRTSKIENSKQPPPVAFNLSNNEDFPPIASPVPSG